MSGRKKPKNNDVLKTKRMTQFIETTNDNIFESLVCHELKKNAKEPTTKGWQQLTDTPNIRSGYNVGVLTGKVNNIFVLDIDPPKCKAQNDGVKQFDTLIKQHNENHQIDTLTVSTPSGGQHLYFEYVEGIETTTGLNGYTIDIRSNGGYCVCPPSTFKSKLYDGKYEVINNSQINKCPLWLLNWIQKHYEKTEQNKKKQLCNDKNDEQHDNDNDDKLIYFYKEEDITDILNELHERDNTYVNDFDKWFKLSCALKRGNLKNVWNEWSKKSPKYDEVKNNNIWRKIKNGVITFGYIKQFDLIEKKNKNDEVEYIKIGSRIKETLDLNMLETTPTKTINTNYLSKVKNPTKWEHLNFEINMRENRVLLIKMATGGGKTTATTCLIKLLNEKNQHKILSIVSRISLGQQHMKNFNDDHNMNFKFYQNVNTDNIDDVKRLIIQVDSLIKIDVDQWKGCILYLDEIHSLLSYIVYSDTLRTKRYEIFETFKKIISNASYIIGCDADMSDAVLKLFQSMNIDYYLLSNEYKNGNNVLATRYYNERVLIEEAKDKISKNKKFVFIFDSISKQQYVLAELKKYSIDNKISWFKDSDILEYSSSRGNDNDFKDVNEKWANKWVFFTPKIIYGLDFNISVKTDVFFYGSSGTLNSLQIAQQIARVRNPDNIYFYINDNIGHLALKTISDVKIMYVDKINNYRQYLKNKKNELVEIKREILQDTFNIVMGDNDEDDSKIRGNAFTNVFFIYELYEHVLNSYPAFHLEKLLINKGFKMDRNYDEIEEETTKEEYDEIKKLIQHIDIVHVLKKKDEYDNDEIKDENKTLTHDEKKVLAHFEKNAKFLNVDLKQILLNEWDHDHINKFIAKMLYIDKDRYDMSALCNGLKEDKDIKLHTQDKKEYDINNMTSTITKINLIHDVEKVLNVDLVNMDTSKCVDKFDNVIQMDETIKKNIYYNFRIDRHKKKMDELNEMKYKTWLYELVGMYKHVYGGDVLGKGIRGKKNNLLYYKYKTNNEHLCNVLKVLGLRDPYYNNISDELLSKFDIVRKERQDTLMSQFKECIF